MVWLCRQCLTSILICFADIPNRQSPRENILELCSKLLHDGKKNLGTDFLVCIIPGLIDLCTALMSLKTEAFRMQSITDDMKIRQDFQSVASDLLFRYFSCILSANQVSLIQYFIIYFQKVMKKFQRSLLIVRTCSCYQGYQLKCRQYSVSIPIKCKIY